VSYNKTRRRLISVPALVEGSALPKAHSGNQMAASCVGGLPGTCPGRFENMRAKFRVPLWPVLYLVWAASLILLCIALWTAERFLKIVLALRRAV
jgi:hypothetical protein